MQQMIGAFALTRGVAGHHADVGRAEDVDQGEELLAHQRLDRRGVVAALAVGERGEVGARRDQGLPRAGRGGQDHVRPHGDLDQRLFLMRVEGEALLGRPARERAVDRVGVRRGVVGRRGQQIGERRHGYFYGALPRRLPGTLRWRPERQRPSRPGPPALYSASAKLHSAGFGTTLFSHVFMTRSKSSNAECSCLILSPRNPRMHGSWNEKRGPCMRIFMKAVTSTAAVGLLAFGAVAGRRRFRLRGHGPARRSRAVATSVDALAGRILPNCTAVAGTIDHPNLDHHRP